MRTFSMLWITLFASLTCSSQAPQTIHYQAILRTSEGAPIRNEVVKLDISITTIADISVYQGAQSASTNQDGLLNIFIGDDSPESEFANMNWVDSQYFIDVKLEGEFMRSSPLLCIPTVLDVNQNVVKGEQVHKGDNGEQGLEGDMEEQGLRGDEGEQGLKGDNGEQGLKGDKGEQGLKGDRGEQGLKGDKGEQGSKGDKGEQGSKGDMGEQGLKGEGGNKTSWITGILLGVLSSFIVWFILSHVIVPNVKFAPFISSIEKVESPGTYKYRIGIRNDGIKAFLDVRLIFELMVFGHDKSAPRNTSYIKLDLKKNHVPRISKKNQWVFTIMTDRLPDSLSKYSGKGLDLKQIMEELDAKARVVAFGYDAFTGNRKMIESKPYTVEGILNKRFDKKYYSRKTKF